jgi:hypothetical protein
VQADELVEVVGQRGAEFTLHRSCLCCAG